MSQTTLTLPCEKLNTSLNDTLTSIVLRSFVPFKIIHWN